MGGRGRRAGMGGAHANFTLSEDTLRAVGTLAREAGVSEAAIEAVRDRKPLDGLPPNEARITLERERWRVPDGIALDGGGRLHPFRGGETLEWRLAAS